ncbi:MAG: MFS transporter [candidate division Zixibacteria bacterium]|nr:MFS transporter [candidate division Zixibacteria bacterium]
MEKNIRRFYWYRLTKFGLFHIAILVLFYQERGLSFSQIMILQSVYYFAKVLSEVPTGAWADRVGRKKLLVLGSFFHSLAYLLIFFSHSLILFILGEIIAGISMSFAYGADSALAYDTLKSLGRGDEYQRVEGNANSMRYLGFALFAPVGGLLATIDLALPYLASSIVIFLSGLIALTLVEPPREKGNTEDSRLSAGMLRMIHTLGVNHMVHTVGQARRKSYCEIQKSLKLLFADKRILWFVLFFSLIFLATRLGFWTYQPYMKQVGLPLSLFGVVLAFFHLFSALVSKYADKLEGVLKEKLMLFIMPTLVVTSFVLLSRFLFLWSISFILIQQVTTAMHEPILKSYLNRYTPSEVRATMLSVQHMAGNAAFAVFAPFLGSLVDQFRLENALLIFALVIILFSSLLWRYRIRWFKPTRILLESAKEET